MAEGKILVVPGSNRRRQATRREPPSLKSLADRHEDGENPQVTMLADEYCDDWDTLWWVRADGRAVILAAQGQMAEPLRLLAQRYWQYRRPRRRGRCWR
jgi:hypothetical protein